MAVGAAGVFVAVAVLVAVRVAVAVVVAVRVLVAVAVAVAVAGAAAHDRTLPARSRRVVQPETVTLSPGVSVSANDAASETIRPRTISRFIR